ncbi:hypothetical protein VIGAN_09160300, partial [Vigna angularis var. angularis]
ARAVILVLLLFVLICREGGNFLPSPFSNFVWVVLCLIDALQECWSLILYRWWWEHVILVPIRLGFRFQFLDF